MEVKYQTTQACFTPFYLTSSTKKSQLFPKGLVEGFLA
jgi:hypothetical protein